MSQNCGRFAYLCLFLFIIKFVAAKYENYAVASGELAVLADGDAYSMRFGNTEFIIWHNKMLTWHGAYNFCENQNSSLVVLNSREKVIQLQMFMVKQNFVQAEINDANKPYIYWIGGNDLKERNKWMWVPINTEFTYTHWLAGEPTRSVDQRCVAMGDRSLGRWSNSPCSKKLYFICERTHKSIRQRNEL
ncbi:C-type lectin 37Db-like [Eurosta solidaginis]|uniref:C-type lectin 37Db-like n=1 Tax=Eurosta solidaginis TaxID=178769 RepID=UPI0035316446